MNILLSSCISLLLTGVVRAQIPSPVPPETGTWTDVRAAQLISRLRQPPPPPAGGFWVVEEHGGRKGLTIVRYYTDDKQKIGADTLRHKRLNISKVRIVYRLNEQLSQALAAETKLALTGH